ncbi:MAG: hypothetical protein ACR2QR_04190 [Woeseiaceae bacterium]
MNSEVDELKPGSDEEELDESQGDDMADTVVLPESEAVETTDNVGDASVEINVEQLIADIEEADDEVSGRKKEVRRRLEELAEEGSHEDTYAIEFDEP